MEAPRAQVTGLRPQSLSGLDLSGWKMAVSFLCNTFPFLSLRIPLTDFQDGSDFGVFAVTVGEDKGLRRSWV